MAGRIAAAGNSTDAGFTWTSDAVAGALVPLLAGVVSLVVYSLTLAPDLTWAHSGGDGGELITAAVSLGVPHPPGYPLYVLLGKLASLLPVGTVAWRFNLFSGVCAAIAVSFATATARAVLQGQRYRDIASLAAGLSIGFSALIWSQAIIAEVYALNLAVVALFIWSVATGRAPFWRGLLLGLAITTHLSSLLLAPLALALTTREHWRALGAGILAGLLPLLLLPFLAQSGSPVIWEDPTTASGWWRLVTAKLYQPNIRPPDTAVLPEAALTLGMAVLRQLAWVGWLIVVLGLSTRIVGRRLTACLLVTAAVYLVYAFVYQTDDASVNLLPALLLITSLLAAGLSRAGAWALLAPLGLLLLNGQAVTPRPAELPRDRAVTILEKAPADAILLTPGDRGIFALWYFQHVEHLGANLAVVDQNLLAFDWYRARLVEQYPSLLALDHDNITHFRTANGQRRAVCDVPPDLAGELVCAHPDTS